MARRGRPRLDESAEAHAPRLAVRLPDDLRSRVARRATEEETTVSDVVRSAVAAWVAGPSAAERAELRRIVRLADRDREALFLVSNANLERLLGRRSG